MKVSRWFLSAAVACLFCFVSVPPLTAQDKPLAEVNLPEIIKRIQPSTVLVITYDKDGKVSGQGSGFFANQTGQIITNRHVLEEASRAEIKTAQGKIHPITHIIAEDKEGDLILASVDIPAGSVQPLKLSDSVPQVGQRIVVIGNPLGLEGTVSDGIVSAVRDIPAFGNIIQLSAPISAGSSGSPVVDMQGQVIGIATFQITEGQNLNFAIPAQRAANLKPGKPKTLTEWQTPAVDERLTSAEALCVRGLIYLWKEDYKQALPFFEKAAEKNPQYAGAWFFIGYCNGQLGRYAEAIEAYKQALRIKPDDTEAHNNLGGAYVKLGRYAEAIEAYKQALRIKPDFAEAHYNLGVTYGILGRFAEAIEAYKQAIRIKPDDAETHYFLGAAYAKLGRDNEAIAACEQAIRIKPDYAEAHGLLGAAYAKLERYAEAIEAFKKAIRIEPDLAKAHYGLGLTYSILGRYAEEIEAYKQAIRIKPDYAKAHFNLGLAYLIIGDRGSALEEYKILKDLDKDFANKLFNLIYK